MLYIKWFVHFHIYRCGCMYNLSSIYYCHILYVKEQALELSWSICSNEKRKHFLTSLTAYWQIVVCWRILRECSSAIFEQTLSRSLCEFHYTIWGGFYVQHTQNCMNANTYRIWLLLLLLFWLLFVVFEYFSSILRAHFIYILCVYCLTIPFFFFSLMFFLYFVFFLCEFHVHSVMFGSVQCATAFVLYVAVKTTLVRMNITFPHKQRILLTSNNNNLALNRLKW